MHIERYIVNDVLALMGKKNQTPRLIATGWQLLALTMQRTSASATRNWSPAS